MNSLASTLLFLSLGQASDGDLPPERPTTLQPPPVIDSAEANEQPRQFRIGDSPREAFPASPAFPAERFAAPKPPTRRQPPAASRRRSVVLTDRTDPVVPVQAKGAIDLANQILSEAVRSIELHGDATPLVSALGLADSTTRSRILKSYWSLSVAIGRYAFAEHEALYLQKLRRPQARTEDAMLQAHAARASARRSQARLNAIHWQERLSELLPNREAGLPVPADMPFVGVYRTQIENLYGRDQAPRRLQEIDRALPHELDIISRRAESIAAFERLVTELSEAYETGAASLGQVLQATEELSEERTKFLDVVLSYNENIADYSLSVVGANAPVTTLLSTLIHAETAARPALLADARVRPASAEAPDRAGEAPTPARETPNTFLRVEPAFSPGSQSILRP
ncbi:MAG: hypothetical protein CMJ64_21195 [Planctomycetaceae bacterium]|nr:hypothetical protein [Planctomycetaceae bacterium]